MRTRSLRRVYIVSFGLSLLGHLILVGAVDRIPLREGTPFQHAGELREWLQLLDVKADIPSAALSTGLETPHLTPSPDRAKRGAGVSAGRLIISEAPELAVPEAGDVGISPSIGERLRGTRDARLSSYTHHAPVDHHSAAAVNERIGAAIEATSDSPASASKDYKDYLARGYHMDGRRILPVDGVAWERLELFRQNERFVRDSIVKESGRVSRERRSEQTSRARRR